MLLILGSISGRENDNFFFSILSRPILATTKPPVQAQGTISRV
jgi:hypothetical protein